MPVSDRTNSNSVVREPDNKGACLPACLLAVPLGGGGGRTHLVAPPRSDVVPATNSLTLARLQHRLGLVCSLEVFNVFGPGIFEPLRVQRERESAADDFSEALVVDVEFDGLLSAAARLGGGGRGRAEDLDFGWRPPSLADPNSTSFCCSCCCCCCERASAEQQRFSTYLSSKRGECGENSRGLHDGAVHWVRPMQRRGVLFRLFFYFLLPRPRGKAPRFHSFPRFVNLQYHYTLAMWW